MHRLRDGSLRSTGVGWELACVCGVTWRYRNQAVLRELLATHIAQHN